MATHPNLTAIQFSRGHNKFDNKPEQLQCTDFDEFEQAVLADVSQEKGQTYICSPLQSGIHYQKPEKYSDEDTWRLKGHVLPRQFIAFDFDGFSRPEVFESMKAFMESYRGFGYTTASHTDKQPRARVILMASSLMTRGECEAASASLERMVAMAVAPDEITFDKSVYRGEQPIYTPVVGAEIFHFDGNPVDVGAVLGMPSKIKRTSRVDLGDCGDFTLPVSVADGSGRESTILKYAGKLRASGLDQEAIDQACLDYNQCHIAPPLGDDIVLDRARRYAPDAKASDVLSQADGWGDPQPIKDALPPIPPFNLSLLPEEVADYVKDVAERMCCPIEFPAIGAFLTLATAIGSRVHCKPYEKDTWIVPGGAWGMIIARPSQLKSPPLSEMLRPLRVIDGAAFIQFQQDEAQYKIDKAIYDHQVKAAVRKGNRNPGVSCPTEPQRTQHVVNDTTYEKMIEIAGANPNGVLMFRDELIGWLHSLNKENQREAKGMFLTGWTGTEGYNTDRIGRGHVRAEQLNISVLGTIQPGVLKSVVNGALNGGEGDDGLIQRFQFAVYPDAVRKFVKVDRHPDFQAQQHYENLVSQLVSLDPAAVGAKFTFDGKAYLHFDDEAQEIFDDWRQALEDRLRESDSDETPTMLAHLGKYRSLFPKIALVLHLAGGGVGPIGKVSARRAQAWALLLESHARRMYHTATNRTIQSAGSLANKIKAGRLADGFTRSDIMLKEWAGLRTADEVRAALSVLEDLGWLKLIEERNTGGRPAQRYYINPKVMTTGKVAA